MAQWSTKYVSALGFECIIVLEDRSISNLVKWAGWIQRAIKKRGGKPVTSRPVLGPGRIPVYDEKAEKKAIAREAARFRRRN